MKQEPDQSDIVRASKWQAEHKDHVARLIAANPGYSIPPSGSDCSRPELWKAAHWAWFVAQKFTEAAE